MRRLFVTFYLLACSVLTGAAQSANSVPLDLRLRLMRAEDTRNWNEDTRQLLKHADPQVRLAAALTAGRIGDERANPSLVELLLRDKDPAVQTMAAFALGEIESEQGADALIAVASNERREPPEIRARALEALGKITAALPESAKEIKALYGKAILDALRFEAGRRSAPDEAVILAGVTAALRARPEGAGPVVAEFLGYSSPRVRADTLNALARLRAKEKLPEVRELLKDPDPIVRANAARVLGAAEDKEAVDTLLVIATKDVDSRARVSAIRALGATGNPAIASQLLIFGETGLREAQKPPVSQDKTGELLEIATTLGRLHREKGNGQALSWVKRVNVVVNGTAPEVHIAWARLNPSSYTSVGSGFIKLKSGQRVVEEQPGRSPDWRHRAALAQGIGEIAVLLKDAKFLKDRELTSEPYLRPIREWALSTLEGGLGVDFLREGKEKVLDRSRNADLTNRNGKITVYPLDAGTAEYLRAYALFKPEEFDLYLRYYLKQRDIVVRSTAADLLGDLPPGDENTKALTDALPVALKDSLNDAAMSILGALAKQKSDKANDAIKAALSAPDYLVRWRAIDLLKRNGVGDFSAQKFPVKSQWTEADYREALALKNVKALVETDKGAFTIQLRPDVAPLNVLSFVRLARRGYFNGITWHRVVPNFVIQGGDPRGDGNGGPGYTLRCEINQLEYERGAVGMALSGKDTGGSQWFVTHSPQPHLDGGYTVFGNVTQGLETVDKIARGDKIRRVRILVGR